MKYATLYPYLRAGSETVSATPWQDDNGAEIFPDGQFRTWDPSTAIRARRQVVVDVCRLRKECRLGPKSKIRVQSIWYSSVSGVRGVSLAPGHFDAGGTNENEKVSGTLEMTVTGNVLGGNIELRTQVVVLDADSTDRLAAREPGNVVWSDVKEILLEGCGARFPVELVKLPPDEQHAGWMLEISEDFEWPFLGGVRLYINSDHPVVRAAITTLEADGVSVLVGSAIYHDIGRQMIAKALSTEDFRRSYDNSVACTYPKASVGQALWVLLRTFLPEKKAADLNQMRIASPERFEAILQHRFRLFGRRDG